MIRAILAGERDPQVLLGLCDVQIRRSRPSASSNRCAATGPNSTCSPWRKPFKAGTMIKASSPPATARSRSSFEKMPETKAPPSEASTKAAKPRRRPGVNAPDTADLREILAQICGAKDLTTSRPYRVQRFAADRRVGTDLTKWPAEKHFTSWLGIAPGNAQSGKRKGRVKRRRQPSRLARALARSKHVALGGFYRRMAARRGDLVANKALARN